ncbi:MAG: phosphohydrolase [Lachnospiraceae bacterium]|nr:phosphohydrolase [Lachnospiraceae bacterium]
MDSRNFQSTRNFIQHGTMPVHRHCLDVANQSIRISKRLGIPCSEKDLIRGALLHDYFLYDWHDKNRANYQKLHGFYHPGIALRNAEKEYRLSPREKDIIKKHMWPLTIVPPRCREAWIVTTADKYCSLLETLKLRGRGNRANVGFVR